MEERRYLRVLVSHDGYYGAVRTPVHNSTSRGPNHAAPVTAGAERRCLGTAGWWRFRTVDHVWTLHAQ